MTKQEQIEYVKHQYENGSTIYWFEDPDKTVQIAILEQDGSTLKYIDDPCIEVIRYFKIIKKLEHL